jgi:alpha-methylacyl-CoA racemase
MSRLGLGYEDLKKINPRLIYCAVTGYGQQGVYKNRAGHDLNYLAIAGILDYTGRKTQAQCHCPFRLLILQVVYMQSQAFWRR